MGEASHSRGGGPSGTAVSAAEEVGAARGAAIGATQGRNPGQIAGVGRGAIGDSNPGGTSGAGWQGATVPEVVSRVPTVETVEPGSQRKYRSVRLGETTRGKLSSSETTCRETIRRFAERSSQR
jgi:hypothetical protein